MKKMVGGQKFTSDMKVPWVVRQWLAQQPTLFFFASDIQKLVERWNKCIMITGLLQVLAALVFSALV